MIDQYETHAPDGRRLRLCSALCDTCIFRDDAARLPLRPGRLRELVSAARADESYVVCHSTFNVEPAVCRGFYDRFSTNTLRIFGRLGGLVEISPPPSKQES